MPPTMAFDDDLKLLGPVADALDHAHHAGIAHLDVKPENVLLSGETVKVADFGLVRAAARGDHQRALAATVPYCAPEVLRGGQVDGRADIYALGVVAWECLVGRPPFEGDQEQVARQHLTGRVPPPSRRVGGVPAAVDAAVWRATDPDPGRRYLRASDFAVALGAPRRRRMDEALRATAVLPASGRDTTVQAAAASPAWEPTAARVPPAPPRPTTGRVPRRQARRAPAPAWPAPRPARRRRGRRLAVVLAGLLAIAAVTATTRALGGSVTAPRVVGEPVGQAKLALTLHGLRSRVGGAVGSPTVRRGLVASQSVAGGRRVGRWTTVTLHPSAGIQLADLTGRTLADASRRLDGLAVRHLERYQTSRTVAAGRVLASDPPAGTVLADGQAVTLVVSLGKPKVAVPFVGGQGYAAARATLAAKGLVAARRRVSDPTVPAGQVVGTSPAAGAVVSVDSTVTVLVSTGPELVVVPQVLGLSKAAAQARLERAGLRARFELFGIGSQVIRQSVPPGRQVPKGTTVSLLLQLL